MRSEAINLSIDSLESRFGVVAKQLAKCDEHGEYAAIITKYSQSPSACPQCSEIRQRARDEQIQREEAEKHQAAMLERKLGASLIPRRFQGKTFDQFHAGTPKQRKVLATCQAYAENFRDNYDAGRCLILLGKPGTGKTHLAASIADHVIRSASASAVYRTVSGILTYIKGSYDRDVEYSEAEAFASLVKPALLIIDEVGATKPTEFEQATLFQIINGRYEEQKPTVVISNLDPHELPAALGERCVDRLREGGGIALVFDWKSVRSEVKG